MQPPPLKLVSSHILISGDVVVDSSAAIALGVLMQADPGCCLTIAAGVCIGQGVVLHAHQGNLTVEAGATLGSGVLIVGQGQIGENACIGAFTTVLNSSIAADQIVPPRSLIGETGRQVPNQTEPPAADLVPDPWAAEPAPRTAPTSPPDFKAGFVGGFSAPGSPNQASGVNGSAASVRPPDNSLYDNSLPDAPVRDPVNDLMSVPKPPTQVYGQAYVERIMIAMFPYRQLIEKPPDNGSTPPNLPT